jgi:modulator of FtsH protease HflC
MNGKLVIIGIVAAVVLWLVLDSVYTVRATERAILLRFGAVKEADIEPGLHFKVPIAERVRKTDGRVLMLDHVPERYLTIEKKPLMVDWYAKWRVNEVSRYYQSSSFEATRAMSLLQQRVSEGLRNQISRRDMHEVISGARDELMAELTADLDRVMRREFGVEVLDVRVKRIDLPPEVSSAVYERMRSERDIEARQHRATGRELAVGIEADAERQTVVIAADAYRRAEEIRGDGDSRAAASYAAAFNQDPEFYGFYRSINAYVNVFRDKDDLMVLDPNSDFFRYLVNHNSIERPAAAASQ